MNKLMRLDSLKKKIKIDEIRVVRISEDHPKYIRKWSEVGEVFSPSVFVFDFLIAASMPTLIGVRGTLVLATISSIVMYHATFFRIWLSMLKCLLAKESTYGLVFRPATNVCNATIRFKFVIWDVISLKVETIYE